MHNTMDILFSVENQVIKRMDDNVIASGSKNFVRAIFALSPVWETEHVLTPVFRVGDKTYTPEMHEGRFLDEKNSCIVPHEVLSSGGIFYVSIFDETDNVRITANESPVRVIQSGYNTADPSLTPTPTVYDEILRSLGDIRNKIVPPDWSQNDSSQPDYIKNRPFYKEQTAVDYVKLYASDMDIDLGLGFYGEKIGLVIGQTYAVDIVSDTGETTAVDCECVDCAEDVELPNNTIPLLRYNSFEIFDGVSMDADGNPVIAETAIYIVADHIVSVTIHGVSSVDEVIHKIPNEFLDVDNTFDANSQKPQSGKAVNNAMHSALNQFMVGTEQIEEISITAEKLADKSVTASKLADNAVTEASLAENSVFGRAIQKGAITRDKLGKACVNEDALMSSIISHLKLQDGAVWGCNLEQPTHLDTIEVTEPIATINPKTRSSQLYIGEINFDRITLYGSICSTSAEQQVLIIASDYRDVSVAYCAAKIPLDFSKTNKWNVYISMEQGLNSTVNVKCTSWGYDSENNYIANNYDSGQEKHSNFFYDGFRNIYLRFGDVNAQQFAADTNISVYGIRSV